MENQFIAGPCSLASRAFMFKDVETIDPIEQVDQTSGIDIDIIAQRSCGTLGRFRDEKTLFFRQKRVGDIDNAQSSAKPGGIDQCRIHMFLKLVGTEYSPRNTAPGGVCLTDMVG